VDRPDIFAAMAAFWWFYAAVVAPWWSFLFRQMLAIRRQSEKEVGTPQTSGTPLTWEHASSWSPDLLSAFLWLIDLAWRARDLVSVGIMTAAMSRWAFRTSFCSVSEPSGGSASGYYACALAWAVILIC